MKEVVSSVPPEQAARSKVAIVKKALIELVIPILVPSQLTARSVVRNVLDCTGVLERKRADRHLAVLYEYFVQ